MINTFPSYSKANWLAKVEKDLRGKPMDSLHFTIAGEAQSPFWHREDHPVQQRPVFPPRSEPCKAGTALEVHDPREANKVILDLLNKGANALWLFSDTVDIVAQQKVILREVLPEFVDIYFQTNAPEARLFSPQFPVFAAAHASAADTPLPQRFAGILQQANASLEAAPADFAPVFWVEADDDYYTTIASLRALRLCYHLMAEAYGQSGRCRITVHPRTGLADKYGSMIGTSAICTAAVIGGANTVFVPSGATEDPREKTFLRRIAINGMNIIDHEAYLNRVADPAAGSYFLEALTDTYGRQIWAAFQQLVAQ